jgi:hypothetical protein
MTITVYPVTPSFAAEIGDVDLSEQVAPADLQAIKEAFTQYAVLIFPNQLLSQDQHLDFARHFGPLETTIGVYRKDAPLRLRKEFADVSNLNHDNEVWVRKADSACSNWATGSGIPIARLSGYRRSHRCFMRVPFRQSVDIRNLPMNAPPTMRFPRRRNSVSVAW